jgi:hypothetical protein
MNGLNNIDMYFDDSSDDMPELDDYMSELNDYMQLDNQIHCREGSDIICMDRLVRDISHNNIQIIQSVGRIL